MGNTNYMFDASKTLITIGNVFSKKYGLWIQIAKEDGFYFAGCTYSGKDYKVRLYRSTPETDRFVEDSALYEIEKAIHRDEVERIWNSL